MSYPSHDAQQVERTEPRGARAGAPEAPGGASRDAESGNTASQNCNLGDQGKSGGFDVLWQGLDTLEVSYRGDTERTAEEELQHLKGLAQSTEARDQARAQLKIGERVFEVSDRGGGRLFAYLLRHPDMRIAFSRGSGKLAPLALVTFQNEYLVSVGPVEAEATARGILGELGDVQGSETVSRCDLAVDIGAAEDIGSWPERAWVTRARDIHRHTSNGVFTGWSVGLGADLSGRLYNKLLEIVAVSRKAYFFDLWKQAGWFFGDPVKRLEYQFRRGVLDRHYLRTVADVVASFPALWRYATESWLRLTVPNDGDATKARWPTHPFRGRVQEIGWDSKYRVLERKPVSTWAPSDRRLSQMFKAVATAVMARDRLESLREASERLIGLLMSNLESVAQWEGGSADELLSEAVIVKRRRYCAGLNKP